MSMTITNTTQLAAPPVLADIAQAAPALAGTDVAAAFADWMGLDASAAPVEAAPNGEAPPQADGESAGSEAQAETAEQPQAQAEQQQLSSLQAMMLTMPAALAIPPQAPVQFMQALPAATADGAAQPEASAPAPVAAVGGSVAFAAPVAQPAAAPAVQPQQPAASAPAVQQQPAGAQAAAPFAAPASQAPAAAPAAEAPAAFDAPVTATGTGAAAPAPAAAVAAATELKLAAAKPADWQQPLREALGERLQLQLSKNIDQAVIRLDPPNLGRVEIAIRHMAGTLEVNISATHTEVVRQLHTISDTMRTDLAQRHLGQFSQFTEVAVNIAAAPRAAAGQQQAFDQQGRQRQQEQAADDNGPGRGLAEAGNPSSTFSLNARESYA